ncbi:MAG: hypothetical protein EKK53_15340 [Burkholderiales bacterium]|nr:MAG: hypothetical protein EKK53_15340 [Burkholderiales bacterium]
MPRVFAPTPFRWTDGVDYAYGWQDVPDDSKARAMKSAGKVSDGTLDSVEDLQVIPSLAAAAANAGAGVSLTVTGLSNSAAAGSANYSALAAALAAVSLLSTGGTVNVPPGLGELAFDRTSEIPSYVRLVAGPGTRLMKAGGGKPFHLMRNRASHGAIYVNGIVPAGGVITIQEPGHPWAVGDVVYVENMQGSNTALNGPQTVLSAVPGVSWTYAATGAGPTNAATVLAFTSRYNPMAGSRFTRTSNVVTVSDPGHRRGVGDRLWVAGLGGANSFNGAIEITAIVPGVSWSYANVGTNETATGTAQVLGDRNISVDYELSGNIDNLTYSGQWGVHITQFGNVSGLEEVIRDARLGWGGRVANHYNVSDVSVPYARASYRCSVLLQFDSYCDRVVVGNAFGENLGDDVVAWGVTAASGAFAETAAPCGPGNMGTLTFGEIYGVSPTGVLKLYCQTGYSLGKVKGRRLYGTGPLAIGDSNTGVSGGNLTSLMIDDVDLTPTSSSTSQVQLGGGAFNSLGEVYFGRLVDNALTAGDTGYLINYASPATTLTIGKLAAGAVARTGIGVLFGASLQTFRVLAADVNVGSAGTYFLAAGASAQIQNVQMANTAFNGAGATSGWLFYEQSGGTFVNFQFMNVQAANARAITGCNSAGLTHNIAAMNCTLASMGQGFGSDVSGTFNLRLTNLVCTSINNNVLQYYVNGTTVRCVGRNISAPNAQFCLFTGTTTISLDCPDIGIDLGANAGAPPSQLSPQTGDQLRNTNATGAGLYGRTAAGAWAKIF